MKKNGFTLVELLAVIIIIGLIFLLAVTNVIPVFRKSKTKGFINDAITLAEAARIKYKDDILNSVDDDLFAGNISGKKCYSIENDLVGTYASNLNTSLQGSVEVCYGSSCTYDTKVWLTNGNMFIDGDVIDENGNNSESLIKGSFTSQDYSSCGVSLTESNIAYNFKSTGGIQSLIIPETGMYRLEVWGAQGGSTYSTPLIHLTGGYGGYSVGEIELTQGSVIYIVVGKEGPSSTPGTAQTLPGGYNGGGSTTTRATKDTSTGGGGGATHIATESGLLSTFTGNQDKLLIVAGGGGGSYSDSDKAGYNAYGGSGGGYEGGSTHQDPNSCYSSCAIFYKPSGGTQTTGGIGVTNWATGAETTTQYIGTFGAGATGVNSFGGGGGGLYGGASGNYVSGAGGSGYIGNSNLTNKSMYCYGCPEALNIPVDNDIFTVSTTGTSRYKNISGCPDGYNSKPVSKCAKAKDGYARITHLS